MMENKSLLFCQGLGGKLNFKEGFVFETEFLYFRDCLHVILKICSRKKGVLEIYQKAYQR